MMRKFSIRLARFIERHPLVFIILAVLISAGAVPGITMLETDTGFSALISSKSKISVDTDIYESRFGGESINILMTGDVADIFSQDNIRAMVEFEDKIVSDAVYRSVDSPLTILELAIEQANRSAAEFQQQLDAAQEQEAQAAISEAAAAGLSEPQQEYAAEQAKAAVLEQFQPRIDQLSQLGPPSLDNPLFINSVLYDASGNISEAMSHFIPDDQHVLISVTPEGNMNDAADLEATKKVETCLSEAGFTGVTTSVISYPLMMDAISVSLSRNITLLLGLSVAAMVLILLFLFRVRWRLLSLLMVGISALWTFGLMGYIGIPLTMTSMAVLPILIGLGIDFSIQFHNRYQEELTRITSVNDAIITSISRMFPVVGVALIATIIGFVTLYISEVPMIQEFGIVLAMGIVICYIVALFLLHSVVIMADRNVPIKKLQSSAVKAGSSIENFLFRLGKLAIRHTLWIFIIAVLFAIGGGVVDQMIPVNTDYESLMPQDNEALVNVRNFRKILGVGGSIIFMVEADDVTNPEVLSWMSDFEDQMVEKYPTIISVTSPAAIISQATGGTIPDEQQIATIFASTPGYYLKKVIADNNTMASLSFTVKHAEFAEIHDLIENIKSEAIAPAGVTISPVGSQVIGAKTLDAVVGSRMTMNFICLGAIFLMLLLIYRRFDRTLFSIIPVGAVIAWSSLDMYLIGIPINPLTAVLGVIVIGIGTEFMVLLTGRYEEEKSNGLAPDEAMITAISRIGRAITTTAMTTLGGFAILMFSNFVLMRDFGIATSLSVLLCLVITIIVMPGVIVWYDKLRLRIAEKKAK